MSLPKISRKVCCFMSSNSDPRFQNMVFRLATEEINTALKKGTYELGQEMRAELRRMVVENYTVYEESQIVGTYRADELRFVIHDHNQNPQGNSFCKNNSHVVELSTSSNDDLAESTFDYRFYVQNDSFVYLIVDVMFDIQMFHYYGLDKKFDTIEKKREFSLLKVKFCKGLPISGRFNRSNDFTKYCSFAFFCRDASNAFDYTKYVKMWEDFVGSINGDKQVFEIANVESLAREIIKECGFGAQVSFRKLANLLKMCKQGETYELVRVRKKPKTKYSKKRLGTLFGKKKIRVGLIKVIPRRLKYKYIKYNSFVDVFEFVA